VILLNELPLGATGKVVKLKLRETLRENILLEGAHENQRTSPTDLQAAYDARPKALDRPRRVWAPTSRE